MTKVYLGIDTHKDSNVIASAFAGRDEPQHLGKISADQNRFLGWLRKFQKKHALKKEEIELCYEAGPTGFVLARRLNGLGYNCVVVAPSKTPVKSGDKVRTDKRDARKWQCPLIVPFFKGHAVVGTSGKSAWGGRDIYRNTL